jgi:hypothetical protein
MKHPLVFPVILLLFLANSPVHGQDWTFAKEKNGIKVYTRTPENSAFKCFRAETDFHATMEQLSQYIGNVKNLNWWDKNVKEIRVLDSEFGKFAKYYLVYHVPWPFSDRDLCVYATISYDTLKGLKIVSAKPLTGVVPEKEGLVRIRNYSQKWTLQRINAGTIHAVLEGAVDPGGSIPAWLYNMVIVETPLNVMGTVKAKTEKTP